MLRLCDEGLLYFSVQIAEADVPAADAYLKRIVAFRVCLCTVKYRTVEDIELKPASVSYIIENPGGGPDHLQRDLIRTFGKCDGEQRERIDIVPDFFHNVSASAPSLPQSSAGRREPLS